jgi:hypothetical protein
MWSLILSRQALQATKRMCAHTWRWWLDSLTSRGLMVSLLFFHGSWTKHGGSLQPLQSASWDSQHPVCASQSRCRSIKIPTLRFTVLGTESDRIGTGWISKINAWDRYRRWKSSAERKSVNNACPPPPQCLGESSVGFLSWAEGEIDQNASTEGKGNRRQAHLTWALSWSRCRRPRWIRACPAISVFDLQPRLCPS